MRIFLTFARSGGSSGKRWPISSLSNAEIVFDNRACFSSRDSMSLGLQALGVGDGGIIRWSKERKKKGLGVAFCPEKAYSRSLYYHPDDWLYNEFVPRATVKSGKQTMITPSFKVDQDESSVIVTINTPYVRVRLHMRTDLCFWPYWSNLQRHKTLIFTYRATSFDSFFGHTFYGIQYYHGRHSRAPILTNRICRLYFPGNIVEDDDSKAVYDPSSGKFTVRISKETKGETFPDLDLLTKLLARRGESEAPKKPLIEVIGSSDNNSSKDDTSALDQEQVQEAINFNWELPQTLPDINIGTSATYGFNSQYSGYFAHVQETMNEVNDITEPEKSTPESRRQIRLETETAHFDEDHYAMDFINDEEVQRVMQFKTLWYKELRRIQKNAKKQENRG